MIAPPEKRKVGSWTLPLTTIIYQHECPTDDQMDWACLCLRVYLHDGSDLLAVDHLGHEGVLVADQP